MAYKTAEQRHEKEFNHDGSFSLENKLRQFLRDNYSKESLESSFACEVAENRLAKIAKKYDLASGKKEDLNKDYNFIASQAIAAYLNDYDENAEDNDRGKRLGKSVDANTSLSNIVDTLSNLRL